MWCNFFQKEEAPNLLKIVQFVCSVPVSNAFVERIFSVMGNVWTDERNRVAVNTEASKEIQRIEVWETRRSRNRSTASNPRPRMSNMEVITHGNRKKCAGAPSCMKHTLWCSMVGTLCGNCGKTCCWKARYFAPLRSLGSICISSHSFGHFSRLDYRPPDGYDCLEFYRLYVVCDPMSYGGWSFSRLPTITPLNLLLELCNTLYNTGSVRKFVSDFIVRRLYV
ncbi:hypothetical protein TNCV_2940491 [Trichonephila clavipes]|nr:hypothetical protein TNCV_2940491 [Trichonephila clavipes]